MSELTTFRDHCRAMATARHKPECEGHQPSRWGWSRSIHPDPNCPGCVTDDDRALWARLADETDAWLSRETEEGLWPTAR